VTSHKKLVILTWARVSLDNKCLFTVCDYLFCFLPSTSGGRFLEDASFQGEKEARCFFCSLRNKSLQISYICRLVLQLRQEARALW
jgi:hypothetical protein